MSVHRWLYFVFVFADLLQRLPAEDLLKTRWIKSASKTPITILKDLLLRYNTWIRTGSKLSDLSEPLPWEREIE